MLTMETDHCEIVAESLAGTRGADEQTFLSMAVLTERLELLKKTHRAFIDVEFSPQAMALTQQEMTLALS